MHPSRKVPTHPIWLIMLENVGKLAHQVKQKEFHVVVLRMATKKLQHWLNPYEILQSRVSIGKNFPLSETAAPSPETAPVPLAVLVPGL